MIKEIQDKIQNFVDQKYKGSLRFIKPKMLEGLIGKTGYNELVEYTKDILDIPLSLRVYHFLNNIPEVPHCKMCEKLVKFNTNTGYQTYCSNECRFKDMDSIQDVKRNTNLKKYGSTNVLASEYGKSKAKETHRAKYGVDHYNQTQEYVDRIKSGDIIRKDASPLIQLKHRKNYFDEILTNNKFVIPHFTFEEYEGVFKTYNFTCKECNYNFNSTLNNKLNEYMCPNCNKQNKGTKSEHKIAKFLIKHNVEFLTRARKPFDNVYELDFYIPDKNIGIEIHGLFWHSDRILSNPTYHLDKLNFFEQRGIRVIQIFEDEFINTPNIVYNRLKHILDLTKYRVYARKCTIKPVPKVIKSKFINKYHIQGDTGSTIDLGLYYKNRLVALMTFNNHRPALGATRVENEYELIRYVTIGNFNIVGGAGKLFKYFTTKYNPNKVTSYADRRWSQGNLYSKLGMKQVSSTQVNYWYTDDFRQRYHRYNFRKSELRAKLAGFDETLTEKQNMERAGWSRVYDCGSFKYEI